MPVNIKTMQQHFEKDKAFCLLVYGLPASGKTMLVGSAQYHPLLKDVAFVDADVDGLMSIAGIEGIQKISYNNLKDLVNLPSILKRDLPSVKTVVFDTLDAVKARRLFEIGIARNDIDKPQLQDFNVVGNNIEKIVVDLRAAGYSIMFTAGSKDEKTKEGVFQRRVPDLPPALRRQIEHIVSFCWHTYHAPDGTFNMVYLDNTGTLPLDLKTRNLAFVEKMRAFDRKDAPGTILLGKTGDDISKYPNLSTFYDILISTLDSKASV